jgi:hypothetical protein
VALIVALVFGRDAHTTKWAILSWVISLGVAALMILLIFLDALIDRLHGKSWDTALEDHFQNAKANRDKEKSKQAEEPGLVIRLSLIPELFLPLIIVIVIFGACFEFGRVTTGYQDHYVTILKPTGSIDQIVIRDYNDQLLLKPFDTKTEKLLPGFSIVTSVNQVFEPALLKCSATYIQNAKKNSGNNNMVAACPHQLLKP